MGIPTRADQERQRVVATRSTFGRGEFELLPLVVLLAAELNGREAYSNVYREVSHAFTFAPSPMESLTKLSK
jgi:hypothetical protein